MYYTDEQLKELEKKLASDLEAVRRVVDAHQERPDEMSRDHARRLFHGCLGAVP